MHSSNQYQFSVFSLNSSSLSKWNSLCWSALVYVGSLFFSFHRFHFVPWICFCFAVVFIFAYSTSPFHLPFTLSPEVTVVNHCDHIFFHVCITLCSVYTKVLGFGGGAEKEGIICFMHPSIFSGLQFLLFLMSFDRRDSNQIIKTMTLEIKVNELGLEGTLYTVEYTHAYTLEFQVSTFTLCTGFLNGYFKPLPPSTYYPVPAPVKKDDFSFSLPRKWDHRVWYPSPLTSIPEHLQLVNQNIIKDGYYW